MWRVSILGSNDSSTLILSHKEEVRTVSSRIFAKRDTIPCLYAIFTHVSTLVLRFVQ